MVKEQWDVSRLQVSYSNRGVVLTRTIYSSFFFFPLDTHLYHNRMLIPALVRQVHPDRDHRRQRRTPENTTAVLAAPQMAGRTRQAVQAGQATPVSLARSSEVIRVLSVTTAVRSKKTHPTVAAALAGVGRKSAHHALSHHAVRPETEERIPNTTFLVHGVTKIKGRAVRTSTVHLVQCICA